MLRQLTEKKTELHIASDARVHDERARMKVWLDRHIALGATKPITEVVTVTPVLAELLLETNQGNRPLSPTNMDRIKRDMSEGRFEFNGESVIISQDGKLNNGQHRCHGIIETGLAQQMVLVFGVDRETRKSLDQGTSRSVGHIIAMDGYEPRTASAVGAAAGFAVQYLRGVVVASTNAGMRPTKSETLAFIKDNPDIVASVDFVSSKPLGSIGASKPLLAFCHWAITHRLPVPDRQAADLFMEMLIVGDGLRKGSAILYVRNRLMEMRRIKSRDINSRAQLIFLAWNHYRRNQRVDRLWVTKNQTLPPLDP